ncbi:MAG: FAD-dependent oxidoreductase, partial [Acetobacteraceae bacterium]|nr:FAD-dependent oxidoreductase [Acetobacteraceae bacterium]
GRATSAGAGIICPWMTGAEDIAFYHLYAAGARVHTELAANLGADNLGYRQNGALVVSADHAELDWIERLLAQRRTAAPEMGETPRLSPSRAKALFPPLHTRFGAVQITGGARVDGRMLAATLQHAAQELGAVSIAGEAVLIAPGSRVVGIRVGEETIAADVVVVTAGAWSPALLQRLGLSLPIAPQRGQILHLRLPHVDTSKWPVVLPLGEHYLVPFDDSRVVAGATRENGVGFDYRVTADGQWQLLNEALRVAPGLSAATVIETRVGFRPLGPDARPLLGWVQGMEGLLVGNGLGAVGLTIGPLAGRLLADAALGREPEIDLAPFDPLRGGVAAEQ